MILWHSCTCWESQHPAALLWSKAMPLNSIINGNLRDGTSTVHSFKNIDASAFIHLKYIHRFPNSASVRKQKTDCFWNHRPFPAPKCSRILFAKFENLVWDVKSNSPDVCRGRQHTHRHIDCSRERGFGVLWIKRCGEENFHWNKNKISSENSHSLQYLIVNISWETQLMEASCHESFCCHYGCLWYWP